MEITQIMLLSLPVSDQDRVRDFYVNTLGFDLVSDTPTPEMRWVQVAPKGADTGITLVTWFPTMKPGSSKGLVLKTPDVDADAERLRQAGVAVSEPADEVWGRFVTFDDPDGNGIVLCTPPQWPDAG